MKDGKLVETTDYKEALRVALATYKGQTMLYPPNVQHKVTDAPTGL